MNDLIAWLSEQHHGLGTFRAFQQKLEYLISEQPQHTALCRLLSSLVGRYVEAFDEEPLPVPVADRAHRQLVDLMASLDPAAGTDRQVSDLNRVAACKLWH
jgi:hypothetical protein